MTLPNELLEEIEDFLQKCVQGEFFDNYDELVTSAYRLRYSLDTSKISIKDILRAIDE